MEVDQEMLAAFKEELKEITDLLFPISEKIRSNYSDGKNYEQFGQIIDRVYGTAATLGYKEIAEYCRSMKGITYKCSQSKLPHAMGQVKDLVLVGVQLLKKMDTAIQDPSQIKKIQYTMQKERERAEEMSRKLFGAIKRTSTAA
jgi:chemotaxis protein histidine kinase CheA